MKLGTKGERSLNRTPPPNSKLFFFVVGSFWTMECIPFCIFSGIRGNTELQDWTCLTSVADSTVCSITHQPNEMLVMSLHLDTIKLGEGERKINRLISKYKDRPLSVPQINYCFIAGPKRNKACLYFD